MEEIPEKKLNPDYNGEKSGMREKLAILSGAVGFLTVLAGFVIIKGELPGGDPVISSQPFVRMSQAMYLLPVSESTYLPFRDWNVPEPELDAKAAVIYDVRSGKIIFQRNIDAPLPIASITKLAAALVVVDEIAPQEVVAIPDEAREIDATPDFSRNDSFFARDLLKVMLVRSSNDAAVAFQAHLRERGLDMVSLMNKKAYDIGMDRTSFMDPAGLNDEGYSTAEDVVKLLQAALSNSEIHSALLIKELAVSSVNKKIEYKYLSTNKLLDTLPNIIGGKTGVTDGALETLALEIDLPEFKSSLVAVVLGTHNRFSEMEKLTQWARQAFKWDTQ